MNTQDMFAEMAKGPVGPMNPDAKTIVLTGGGTAGHVMPNLALVPRLNELGYEINYIGSYTGIEKQLIEDHGLTYYGISSGKLRRYLSLQNLSDPIRVVKGYGEARKLLKTLKPDIVFSKGGFVSVPVVVAAHELNIPVIIHESDMTPGLANKICIPAADRICCNFPETLQHLPKEKAVLSGSPLRQELFQGDREKARELCGFNQELPVLLVTGGSLGSVILNNIVRKVLPDLLQEFQVLHLCGKGHLDETLNNTPGYFQMEFASSEMADFFALSDIVVSRAGANAICELLALRKPHLLIPLSRQSSRGDQILNARSFEAQGFSSVMEEEEVTEERFLAQLHELHEHRDSYISTMAAAGQDQAIDTITGLIDELQEAREGKTRHQIFKENRKAKKEAKREIRTNNAVKRLKDRS